MQKIKEKGFTFPELIVVIGVSTILFGFITANLFSIQHRTSVASVVHTLISDIKSQQSKAMNGATEGRAAADSYGIHLEVGKYVLFHGTSYSQNDSSNFTVTLDKNIQFSSITLPNAQIIFSQGSGEVSGFASGSNSIVIKNLVGNEQKTIVVNRYGAITSVN